MRPIRPSTRVSQGRGFTLIELAVTITVLAILAFLAVPSYLDYTARSRVRSAVDGMVNQFALARSEAVRLHRNVLVTLVAGANDWCSGGRQFVAAGVEGITLAADNAPSCDCSTSAGAALCLVNGQPSLVSSADNSTVSWIGATNSSYQFDSNVGVIKDLNGGEVTLGSKSRPNRYRVKVVISPLGHARACVPTGYAMFGGYRSCS